MSQDAAAVIREHAPFIWRTLRYLGAPAAQLEDLCQDVCIVILRKLSSFEERSALRTWIYGICRNVAPTAPVELTLEPRVEPEIERPPVRLERTPRTRPRRTQTTAPDRSAELELLQRARSAMPGDARRARDLLRSHERQFGQGTFAEEREVLWVEALLALGREPEAPARSERLRKVAPATAYRRRIDELLERRRTLKLS